MCGTGIDPVRLPNLKGVPKNQDLQPSKHMMTWGEFSSPSYKTNCSTEAIPIESSPQPNLQSLNKRRSENKNRLFSRNVELRVLILVISSQAGALSKRKTTPSTHIVERRWKMVKGVSTGNTVPCLIGYCQVATSFGSLWSSTWQGEVAVQGISLPPEAQ